tara:strand:+ start:1848 stop:2132 length:285 start_codon:yes stop_codon:yes gene_type:complete
VGEKMRALKVYFLAALLVCFSGCNLSGPEDLEPIISGKHDVAKVYYPSTDSKVSAVVLTVSGDVYYYRANGLGTLRDEVLLFNVNDHNWEGVKK